MNFVEELRWRGMLHDIMPDTETYLLENKVTGYIGFDPTGDSLHIGSLVQIMILVHFGAQAEGRHRKTTNILILGLFLGPRPREGPGRPKKDHFGPFSGPGRGKAPED